jgi:mannose-6-phosphate isomerase
MPVHELYPLQFKPIYKQYIWGGRNLEKIGKKIPPGEIVAESWEISDHDDDVSVVANGKLTGRSLRELIHTYTTDICPETENGRFPILIKYIDANRRLSVQVHPDDEYARAHESPTELGKNECWYVMDAPAGAELILGVTKGMTKERFRELIEIGRIEDGLTRYPVTKGDFIFIKSGTVHAIMEGIMVCEIQENSDTTYRLYDWGRLGTDGKPRPLHLDKALDVINYLPESEYDAYVKKLAIPYNRSTKNTVHTFVRSKFFNIDLIKYSHDFETEFQGEHFHTLNIVGGAGSMQWREGELEFNTGDTLLVPCTVRDYTIRTAEVDVLRASL